LFSSLPGQCYPKPMKPRYVSVIGAGRCGPAQYALAEEVGRFVAERGATLVCGGLSGVMEAAARGAKESGGATIGILPGHDRRLGNPYLDHVVTTGMGEARNLAVVSSGDVVVAIGGGFGTLSEIGLAGKIGRPVVILSGWRLDNDDLPQGLWYASSPREAFSLIDTLPDGSADERMVRD
jgi:uncharacterized protein (TIGR00725 family)